MTARMSTTVPWPNPSEVLRPHGRRQSISTQSDRHHDLRVDQQQRDDAMACNFVTAAIAPKRALMLATAAFGATFVNAGLGNGPKLIM